MTESKASLRKKLLQLLRLQKEEERLKKSRLIKHKLFSSAAFKEARTVLFYASFDGEVPTWEMMREAKRQGKVIGLPVISRSHRKIVPSRVLNIDTELELGPYGVMQPKAAFLRPIALDDIDLVVVPGVAFDKYGNRLGRGKGYYDRLLAQLPPSLPAIGLAFAFQILDELPQLACHDCPVITVITD
ncbi:MAG: 5-formyltetrahydrofolate cyclo-ligase [Candidatus Omnitrophota bacterium]